MYSIWPSQDENHHFLILTVFLHWIYIFFPPPESYLEQDYGNKQYVRILGCFYSWILLWMHIRLDEKPIILAIWVLKINLRGKYSIFATCHVTLRRLLRNGDIFYLVCRCFQNMQNRLFLKKASHVVIKHFRTQRESWKLFYQNILKAET